MQPDASKIALLTVEAGQLNRILSVYVLGNSLAQSGQSEEEAVQTLLEEVRQLLDSHTVAAGFFEPDGYLVCTAATGKNSDKLLNRRWPGDSWPIAKVRQRQQGLLEQVSPRSALVSADFETSPAPAGNAIYAPIGHSPEIAGVVWAARAPGDRFFPVDLELLEHAGRVLAQLSIGKATQDEDQRLEHLFEAGFDPIVVTDQAGVVVEANTRALELLDLGGLLGQSLIAVYVDSSKVPDLSELPVGGQLTFQSLVVGKSRESGQGEALYPMEIRVKRLARSGKSCCQWIFHDLSNKVELEQMRQDLVAMLVHDLQSPLGNVISSLELIKMALHKTRQDPDLLSLLDVASRSSNQLLRLIQSLLDISRLEAGLSLGEKSAVHLQKLVEEVYEIERPSFERRGVQLESGVPLDLPLIHVEPNVIARVLLNLLDNALKYSQEDQTITIDAQEAESGMVLISVSDEGVGIPEAYRQTVFEKYERIKTASSSKGLGLGLAFCRLAVEAHGGRIWVDDADRGGARFNFTLPKAPSSGATHPVLVRS